jgi:hypothetical protein
MFALNMEWLIIEVEETSVELYEKELSKLATNLHNIGMKL